MKVPDANVLIALHRSDHPHHARATAWWDREQTAGALIGLSTQSAVATIRICTGPRAFSPPSTVEEVTTFLGAVLSAPSVRQLLVGPRHLEILGRLCAEYDVRGKTVSDAHLAALAVEHAATVVTFDRDFARFESVPWELPA